jgi:hypothetical protein
VAAAYTPSLKLCGAAKALASYCRLIVSIAASLTSTPCRSVDWARQAGDDSSPLTIVPSVIQFCRCGRVKA